ncbi:MAG: DUF2589 domain-containing protein [Alphaproteobacteria bacterium]
MPVSGRELASLDFSNLIGGPLNAIVEAQAKSAITTANFIKEVGFTKDNKVVNVDFTYNKKNDSGSDEEFTLTLPFITMLPVPYISISYAEVEFNAKITSTTESKTEDNFSQVVDASAGGGWWFASARVSSKTSYQKKSSYSDKEERTFDMHVRVEARNVDMPTGTERILTLLENTIQERSHNKLLSVGLSVKSVDVPTKKLTVEGADLASGKKGDGFAYGETIFVLADAPDATSRTITLTTDPTTAMIGKTINLKPVFTGAVDSAGKKLTLSDDPTGRVKAGDVLTNGKIEHSVVSIDATSKTVTFDNVNGFVATENLIKR